MIKDLTLNNNMHNLLDLNLVKSTTNYPKTDCKPNLNKQSTMNTVKTKKRITSEGEKTQENTIPSKLSKKRNNSKNSNKVKISP